MFAGLDDVEKLKSISPAKGVLTDILIEEATECREADIKQLEKRLRGLSIVPKRITLLFNPILRSHWIFTKYFKGKFQDGDTQYQDEKLSILKTTYKDNRFLEPDDIAGLEDETDEYFYNVYTLGNWGALGDVIFTNWRIEDLTEQAKGFDNFRNGLDFGYAADPAALNRMHYDRKRGIIYITDEVHEYGLTNPELVIKIKPVIGTDRLVCDSAEPKSIQELCNEQIVAVGAAKGKDSVNFGIQWLKQNEIVIDRQCQETINEFQLYQWKKTRSGETINRPIDTHNHHCFVGETLIKTLRGDIRIDELRNDDLVLTRHGYERILWHGKTREANTVKAFFSDGTWLEGVRSHRLITSQDKKVSLQSLTFCDILLKNTGRMSQWLVNRLYMKGLDIELYELFKIFSIVNRFTPQMGKALLFRKGLKFIISIGINLITGLKTLCFCPGMTTNGSTRANAPRLNVKTWIGFDHLQLHGIEAKKAENGINIMQSRYTRNENLWTKLVLFAGQNIKTSQDVKTQSFAQTNANQNSVEIRALTMWKGFVFFAEKLLKRINTRLLKHVRVLAVTDTGIKKSVYNLKVDSFLHEYYANGILVANCDAIRYALEDDMEWANHAIEFQSTGRKRHYATMKNF